MPPVRPGTPRCGRPTKVCDACGHHTDCHRAQACVTHGPTAACLHSKPPKQPLPCQSFRARPCDSARLMANGCCRAHGGKNVSGVAHPNYQGKGYSKYLPSRLQEAYALALENTDWLSLRQELALVETRIAEVVREGEDGTFVSERVHAAASEVVAAYRALAAARTDPEQMAAALTALGYAVNGLEAALRPAAVAAAAKRREQSLVVTMERLKRSENLKERSDFEKLTVEQVLMRDHVMLEAFKVAAHEVIRDGTVEAAFLGRVSRIYAEFVGRREAPALGAGDRAGVVLDAQHSPAAD